MKRAERVRLLRDAEREAAGALSGLLHGRHATFERKLQAARDLLGMAQNGLAVKGDLRIEHCGMPVRVNDWKPDQASVTLYASCAKCNVVFTIEVEEVKRHR